MLKLRDYQIEAVERTEAAWAKGTRRPAIVLPTGTGKTVVFAELARRWIVRRPNDRVLAIAHRQELIDQAVGKIRSAAPDMTIGVVKAERNETLARIIVGSVQTLRSQHRRLMLRNIGLVIVDECHHATASSYMEILEHYGCFQGIGMPGAYAVGFTATLVRGDDASLGDIWQDVVCRRDIASMIQDGWLCRPYGKRIYVDGLDLSKVKKIGGDYSDGDLGRALQDSLAPEAVAKAINEHARDRMTIVFSPTVAVAELMTGAIKESGLSVQTVHGAMAPGERRKFFDDFRSGQFQIASNCMVMTEGTDIPPASCAVIARPTTHHGLYVQMCGRVLRPWPGKTDALILDVVGASKRFALNAPIDLLGDPTKKTDKDEQQLADLDDLLEESLGGGGAPKRWIDGPLKHEEVDLFHGSASMWLRTYGGYWFLNAGDRYIVIVPSKNGMWHVSTMHKSRHGTGRWIITNVPDFSYAMAWAEADITDKEMTTARKSRPWRARPVSDRQRDFAKRLRLNITPEMLSGEVGNAITVCLASGRIDNAGWSGE